MLVLILFYEQANSVVKVVKGRQTSLFLVLSLPLSLCLSNVEIEVPYIWKPPNCLFLILFNKKIIRSYSTFLLLVFTVCSFLSFLYRSCLCILFVCFFLYFYIFNCSNVLYLLSYSNSFQVFILLNIPLI